MWSSLYIYFYKELLESPLEMGSSIPCRRQKVRSHWLRCQGGDGVTVELVCAVCRRPCPVPTPAFSMLRRKSVTPRARWKGGGPRPPSVKPSHSLGIDVSSYVSLTKGSLVEYVKSDHKSLRSRSKGNWAKDLN